MDLRAGRSGVAEQGEDLVVVLARGALTDPDSGDGVSGVDGAGSPAKPPVSLGFGGAVDGQAGGGDVATGSQFRFRGGEVFGGPSAVLLTGPPWRS